MLCLSRELSFMSLRAHSLTVSLTNCTWPLMIISQAVSSMRELTCSRVRVEHVDPTGSFRWLWRPDVPALQAMTAALGASPGRSHAGFATADAGTNGGIISELGGDRHEVAWTVVACFKAISSCFRACAGAHALATTRALVRGEGDRSVCMVSRLLSARNLTHASRTMTAESWCMEAASTFCR